MNSWVALPSTGDRRSRALQLARAHDAVLSGAPPSTEVRGVIADSWRRWHQSLPDQRERSEFYALE